MFKNVLVTGGAGFIGSHMVDLLLEKGYKVRVVDNLEPQVHGQLEDWPAYCNRGAEYRRGDVRDRDFMIKALEGIDAIVHDAAMVGVGQSQYQIHRYTSVNVDGTALLLDILANEKTSVERLLVASSMSIYGEGLYRRPSDGATFPGTPRPDSQLEQGEFEMLDPKTREKLEPVPTPETKPLHCTSIYALGKKDQEEYCLMAGKTLKLPTVAGRYFNVYGERQSLSNPYTGAAAIFMSRIKAGNAPLIYEDGHQVRDFIHVRDLVEAKLSLLENPKADGEAYNICTGRPTSILQLAEELCKLLGRPDLIPDVVKKFRSGDIRHCFGDNSRLKELGWTSRISLSEGLQKLVTWAAEAPSEDKVSQAHAELAQRGLIR
jgi:dTDP-L-rhamnose 4-epimerase